MKKEQNSILKKRKSLNISNVSETDSGGCKKVDLVDKKNVISECLRKFQFKKIQIIKKYLIHEFKKIAMKKDQKSD